MRSLLALLLFVAVSASCEPPLVRTPDGFAVPQPNPQFHFPRDHGSHPEFRIEWWYVTGHLWDHASNRFGFQITFFRSAGPRTERDAGTAAFGTDQVFLTHAALLDVTGRRFLHQERLNREGWDAGASTNTLRVWNGNGSLEWAGSPDGQGLFLKAGIRSEAGFDLVLRPIKPLVARRLAERPQVCASLQPGRWAFRVAVCLAASPADSLAELPPLLLARS